MKKSLRKSVLLFFGMLLLVSLSCEAQKLPIQKKELPAQAQKFIDTYFASDDLVYIIKKPKVFSTEYKVRTQQGVEIEFKEDGTWEEVEGLNLPTAFLPRKAQAYIATNFPKGVVTKVERKKKGYEVELSNDLDLYFDTNGNFIGMDD